MGTKIIDFFLKFEIEFDLYFDLCWKAEIIQVGLNMNLYVDIGDTSSSLWGSTSSFFFFIIIIIFFLFFFFCQCFQFTHCLGLKVSIGEKL